MIGDRESMSGMPTRMWRAALLDPEIFEEVEADRTLRTECQAAGTVILAAIAAGLGGIANHGMAGIFWHTLAQVAGWWVWAFVTYKIGTVLLPGPHTEADHGELRRTVGFSSAPGLLRVLGVFEPLAGPLFLIAGLWMLVAMVVAVRQALDYESTGRAIAVCAIPFPIYLIVQSLSLLLLGPWPI